MTEEPKSDEPLADDIPETVDPDDLPSLNRALEALFTVLRDVRRQRDNHNERAATAIALMAAVSFLKLFRPVSTELLHVPLLNLANALAALDNNTVEPILRPTKRRGRARSSLRRFSLWGTAVGAARRLELTGLRPEDANKQVAKKLTKLGISTAHGSNDITARTVRLWRQRVDEGGQIASATHRTPDLRAGEEDDGWIVASIIAEQMMTDEWAIKIQTRPTAEARKFILSALDEYVRHVEPLKKLAADQNPPKPPI
jgi:hypothetical protein